jgi:hypothetical protein
MNLTALTCTYERPAAMELCRKYIDRQTRQPDQWLVLDGPEPMPIKVLKAIESGQVKGEGLVWIEDDDWYHPDWLAWCAKQLESFDIVGQGDAFYYSVRHRWWSECCNVRHAALCQTAITSDLFEYLCNTIKSYDSPFFDTRLWLKDGGRYLHMPRNDSERFVVGIKGMPGKPGYSGEHRSINPEGVHQDWNLIRLEEVIGLDAYAYREFWERPYLRHHKHYDFREMEIEVHIIAFNEEDILPWTLRHYAQFASKIVVHDAGSTDRTRQIALQYGAVVPWDTGGQMNDATTRDLKNECWRGTEADWVIVVDADELIYFPEGIADTLETYARLDIGIVKPHGFEMFSETFPSGPGQLYDHVKIGARDDKWYAKPVMFSPTIVAESGFGIGAHESRPVLYDGRAVNMREDTAKTYPPVFMLHCHQLGPIDRIARRYDGMRARLSERNVRENWGNVHDDGLTHATKKREYILPRLERVIK